MPLVKIDNLGPIEPSPIPDTTPDSPSINGDESVVSRRCFGGSFGYEQGFQGKIERFNRELQEKFWRRIQFKNTKDIEKRLAEYVQAHRLAHQAKIITAPGRRPFPKRWKRDDAKPPQGKIIDLRRTDGSGRVRFLEREFLVSEHWINRLVRVEVDLDDGKVNFFALRRAEWKTQRLLKTMKFALTKKTTCD